MGEWNDPNTGRFGPNNRANPGGRPKGSGRTIGDELRKILESDLADGQNVAEVMAKTLLTIIKRALDAGELAVALKAIERIKDWTEGKSRQSTPEGTGEPTVIRVEYSDADDSAEPDDADTDDPGAQAAR
jgi:hypothetical protein